MGAWSKEACRVIQEVLASLPKNATLVDKRNALRDAYPFGPREYSPYKTWCRQVRKALGLPKHNKKVDKSPTLFDQQEG